MRDEKWFLDWRFYISVAMCIAVLSLGFGLVAAFESRDRALTALEDQTERLARSEARVDQLLRQLEDAGITPVERPDGPDGNAPVVVVPEEED